jgi:hypothetical protein
MSQSEATVIVDDSSSRRGIAALQRLAQRRRTGAPLRFNPFGLVSRTRVGIEEALLSADSPPGDAANGAATASADAPVAVTRTLMDVVEFGHVPSGLRLPALTLRSEVAAATASDLRAADGDGVDNTGSYHWAAEDVLAHLLLRDGAALVDWSGRPTVVELGAGVGLAGLLLAASGRARVVVTDGNRRVVELLAANAERVRRHCGEACSVEARLLQWQDPAMFGADLRRARVVVGADCLFFEAFHAHLARLVLCFLDGDAIDASEREDDTNPGDTNGAPPASARDRRCIFVAPSRGGSLERFVEVLDREALQWHWRSRSACAEGPGDVAGDDAHPVRCTVLDDYDATVSAVHARMLADGASGYVADRHFPRLVLISRR